MLQKNTSSTWVIFNKAIFGRAVSICSFDKFMMSQYVIVKMDGCGEIFLRRVYPYYTSMPCYLPLIWSHCCLLALRLLVWLLRHTRTHQAWKILCVLSNIDLNPSVKVSKLIYLMEIIKWKVMTSKVKGVMTPILVTGRYRIFRIPCKRGQAI